MKYPEILSFEDALQQLDSFDAIIDARSPSEYAIDHLPGAINAPVLDDQQRIRVGTMYKQIGAFDAKKVGAALVAKNIADHIEQLWLAQPRDWRPLVYCWRGGNRSGSMAHILAKIGWPVAQLDGGYKAFRAHVNAALELAPALAFKVICGTTGSGKSRLLEVLHAQGAQVLDLEQLAAHRGSVLGNLPSQPQPSQKAFETRIWNTLRRFDPSRPVFVESESKKVGNLRVPAALMETMRASDCISLTLSRANRVRLLMEDYQHFLIDPAMLNQQLAHLAPLHGREKISRWQAMSNAGEMAPLVEELLAEHYDPAYLRSIDRNFLQFNQAAPLRLDHIDSAAFQAAALQLIATTG
jgi:tRNA 2-selenouridine synthase